MRFGRGRILFGGELRTTHGKKQGDFAGAAAAGLVFLLDYAQKMPNTAVHAQLFAPFAREGVAGVLAPIHVATGQIKIAVLAIAAHEHFAGAHASATGENLNGGGRVFH